MLEYLTTEPIAHANTLYTSFANRITQNNV